MEYHYVYVILNQNKGYRYVGMSTNVTKRIDQHNLGKTRSTKPYRPFHLLLTERFESRNQARKREKFLKGGSGREWLDDLQQKTYQYFGNMRAWRNW